MQRVRVDERMDDPGIDPAMHAHALAGLARLNAWSRSDRLLWPAIEREARARGGELHVMDVACGAADGPMRMANRAAALGLRVTWTLVDAHAGSIDAARARVAAAGVRANVIRHDVVAAGIPGHADVVTCSLFLHHLERADAVRLLASMRTAARRAVAVADLDRSRTGLVLAWTASRALSRSPVVHFDAPASVRGAFSSEEAREMAREAGLTSASVRRAWPARWVLDWRAA
jgi:2-polyprenyl-3-methyl-5-hydroxy-6-metoxy-1,4-benzoquinol methylase